MSDESRSADATPFPVEGWVCPHACGHKREEHRLLSESPQRIECPRSETARGSAASTGFESFEHARKDPDANRCDQCHINVWGGEPEAFRCEDERDHPGLHTYDRWDFRAKLATPKYGAPISCCSDSECPMKGWYHAHLKDPRRPTATAPSGDAEWLDMFDAVDDFLREWRRGRAEERAEIVAAVSRLQDAFDARLGVQRRESPTPERDPAAEMAIAIMFAQWVADVAYRQMTCGNGIHSFGHGEACHYCGARDE